MTSRIEVANRIEKLINKLSRQLPPQEIQNGWTEDSRKAMLDFFQRLHSDLVAGVAVSTKTEYITIPRGMDHWGITDGELLEEAAKISDAIKRLN